MNMVDVSSNAPFKNVLHKSLGLDLGSNSLGWAVLDDDTGNILDKGVVVFPEGIDAANDTLDTPAAIRRKARAGRRMKFRRKMRKWVLLDILIREQMVPLTKEELNRWRKDGKYPTDNKAFISWLKATESANPYIDRSNAASGPVDPYVLGRALYHIAQRRGFKSSRKDISSSGESTEDALKIGKVQGDITELTKAIEKSGCRTLGQYFCKILEENKGQLSKARIRTHYTGRIEHYEREFDVIMDMQGYCKGDKLREDLHSALFMQRPLRSQKHLVGKCTLEVKYPRCRISHPAFEEFRMLSFVNNLMFEDIDGQKVPLNEEDRKEVCEAFMTASPTLKFGDIRKRKYFKAKRRTTGLDFYYYRDDEILSSCMISHSLRKKFGSVEYDKQKVFDALCFYDDDDKLKGWLKKHYPSLTEAQVASVTNIKPREGYAKYSLKAINLMLRFLRKGHMLSEARVLAKLPYVLTDFNDNEEEIVLHLQELKFEHDKLKSEHGKSWRSKKAPLPRLYDMYRDYFEKHWGLDEKSWNSLYINEDSVYRVERCGRIPKVELGMIRNPLVQRAMTTLRRLVNYLYDHDKIDEDTVIRIELARDVNNLAARQALEKWQKARAEERNVARIEIAKYGKAPTEDGIDRYLLWEEQGKQCLYTGRTIDLAKLLSGNVFDIEHTVPRSLSGDDSIANKTLCEVQYNREIKKGHIPSECPNYEDICVRLRPWEERLARLETDFRSQSRKVKMCSDPAQRLAARVKSLVTKRELDYWKEKLLRFKISADRLLVADGELGGFKKRQLVDTGIMTSHAVSLLKSVYSHVYTVKGVATAFARKAWGIQEDANKDRTDHIHHAKDAMVIAALTPARFNAICAALKDDGSDLRRLCDICPPPFVGFAEKVRRATSEILVKHVSRQTTLRQSSKRNVLAKSHPIGGVVGAPIVKKVLSKGDTIRGQLHNETFYGCIIKPGTSEKLFVVRKSLIGPVNNAKKIADKIIDPVIKDIVRSSIAEIENRGAKNIAAGDIRMPSGVPVNKVRIISADVKNPMDLRSHTMVSSKPYKVPYYVKASAGSNFRLAVFKKANVVNVVPENSLLWAKNHKKTGYVPLHQQEGFIGYIMPGTMAIAHKEGHPEEVLGLPAQEIRNRLYKVVKFEGAGRITLRFHSEARSSVDLSAFLKEKHNGKYGAGVSKISFDHPHELLLLSPSVYARQLLFEGIDFKMMLDGSIHFFAME